MKCSAKPSARLLRSGSLHRLPSRPANGRLPAFPSRQLKPSASQLGTCSLQLAACGLRLAACGLRLAAKEKCTSPDTKRHKLAQFFQVERSCHKPMVHAAFKGCPHAPNAVHGCESVHKQCRRRITSLASHQERNLAVPYSYRATSPLRWPLTSWASPALDAACPVAARCSMTALHFWT
ncbi:hypothetical protein CN228_30725 [Pseudomonas syringae pv. actinidiae str. Shaanxi_M228]|nr:hypothetical protein CN228_30725 [Pseudomonas syringae pv. actinidiae str. Shaanxi_M228]